MQIKIPAKGLLVDYLGQFNKLSTPTQLIFFVTAKCNFQCPACFYWAGVNAPQNELTLIEIQKISSSLKNLSRLLISGGEPFLRKDLPDICQIFYQQNKVQGIDLPTNGSLTGIITQQSELILQKCANINLVIGISLDALEETHDALRKKPGSFKSAVQTIKSLSELKKHYPNLYIHIISVVSAKSISGIPGLIKYLRENFDIDSFGPNPIRGNPKDTTLLPPTGRQWLSLFKELSIYYKYFTAKRYRSFFKRYFIYAQRRYLDKITAQTLSGKPLAFSCKAGSTIAVLEPNGALKLCELTAAVGNLRDAGYDFKKLWLGPESEILRKQIKGCACTHGCFLTPSIILNPYHLLRSLMPI